MFNPFMPGENFTLAEGILFISSPDVPMGINGLKNDVTTFSRGHVFYPGFSAFNLYDLILI